MIETFCPLGSDFRSSRIFRTFSMTGTRLPLLAFALIFFSAAGMEAQTFSPIPTLYFTKSFGGADPLPQNDNLYEYRD